ncbi:hypothetical protein CEXT_744741 [Caerostris extrusa]|uniref:PPAF-2-like Clip domain-containing protein n=1 Tax=Caerostris extrusa TaxID=172846 RepID=A0AAV4WGX9_CAEEX|nr:hypothetical protein CEXT_744741 [Caerostris extrusa]
MIILLPFTTGQIRPIFRPEYADSSSVHIDDSENDRVTDNCMCVPYYVCKNGKIVDGRYEVRRSVNIRKRQVNEEQDTPYCPSYLDLCCQPSQSSRTIRSVQMWE